MAHSEVCPVCNGNGVHKVDSKFNNFCDDRIIKKCHGCDGKGWVTVQDNELPKNNMQTSKNIDYSAYKTCKKGFITR